MNFGFVESTNETKCQLNLYFTLICKAMKDCSCGLPFPCDHCNLCHMMLYLNAVFQFNNQYFVL